MRTWTDYEKYVRSTNVNERNNRNDVVEIIDIAGAIVLRRAAIGMSRETLAHKTGISPTTIINIETMKMSPSFENTIAIFNSLGLKLKICVK